MVNQLACSFNLRGHIGQFELHGLVLENGLSKTDAVFAVLQGRIKGQMGLRFQPTGTGMPAILPGSYQFSVDLTTTAAYYKDITILFDFINNGRQSPTGYRYIFRMQGPGFGPPPTITRLSSI